MYITLTKKRLFVMLCFFCSVLFILVQFFSVKAEGITLSTNAQRVEYINTLGVTVTSDEYTSKTVVIPQEFGAVYSKYNVLQREANFDLRNFRGKEVTVYTYNCDGERLVNLIVFKDKLIGGDIAEARLGGSMVPLRR